ncbi:MAG: SRPBCC family protein [Planctomycetota bacterium]
MQTELSVDVDRPIQEVFDRTLRDVSAWSITCVEDEVLEETPEGVGTRFRIVTEDRGQRMEFTGEVLEQDAPHRSRAVMVGKSFDIDVTYLFEEIPTGTRVTQDTTVTGKGLFKIVLPVMGFLMKKATCDAQQSELQSLKEYCERDEQAAHAES